MDKIDMSYYCERCNTIMSITRNLNNYGVKLDTETPDTVSDTDEIKIDDDFYERVLKLIVEDKDITDDDLNNINLVDITKTPYYKKMDGKGEIKKKIIAMKEDLDNSDINVDAYLVCSNCHFNKKIPNQFLVLTKNPEGVADTYDYIDEDMHRNKIYSRTFPRTRNFSCSNKSCPSKKKGVTPEACFFRKRNMFQTVFVCVHCSTIKYM
jgi:DNA-directed RNA polymerase subunit RPC12/RpoP